MLCRDYAGRFEYFESGISGFLPKRELFIDALFPLNTNGKKVFDVDLDGDIDIIFESHDKYYLFTRPDISALPQYNNSRSYPYLSGAVADLDGDSNFDIVEVEKEQGGRIATLTYAKNTGTNINPTYEFSNSATELEQCNSSFVEIADANRGELGFVSQIYIEDIALVDIDGDNDLDLYSLLHIRGDDFEDFNADKVLVTMTVPGSEVTVFCENVGSATDPLFAPCQAKTVDDPDTVFEEIVFSDMDGDGDKDAWIGASYYDNVGNSKEPLFRHHDNLLFY